MITKIPSTVNVTPLATPTGPVADAFSADVIVTFAFSSASLIRKMSPGLDPTVPLSPLK